MRGNEVKQGLKYKVFSRMTTWTRKLFVANLESTFTPWTLFEANRRLTVDHLKYSEVESMKRTPSCPRLNVYIRCTLKIVFVNAPKTGQNTSESDLAPAFTRTSSKTATKYWMSNNMRSRTYV